MSTQGPSAPRPLRILALARLAVPIAVLLFGAPPETASARSEEDLTELSLAELLEAELTALGITGIHHTHEQGEVMLGYSFMTMWMEGNRDGDARVGVDDVLAEFPVAPTDMDMHMLHLMWAPTARLTLMAMIPYVRLSMDHETRSGRKFTTRADGLGDVSAKALLSVYRDETHRLVLEADTSFPTGSIDVKDDTPMGRVRLPYPMQLGSGTYDLLPGLTYLGQAPGWAWGGHAGGVLCLGRNDNDYRQGHRARATTWLARKLTPWMSASLRLLREAWGNHKGADPRLVPGIVPTTDPTRRGGKRMEALLGVNFFTLDGPPPRHRLAIEYGYAFYRWLQGPQLELDGRLSVAWDWVF